MAQRNALIAAARRVRLEELCEFADFGDFEDPAEFVRFAASCDPDKAEALDEALLIFDAQQRGAPLFRMRYSAMTVRRGAEIPPLTFRFNSLREYREGRDYVVPRGVVEAAQRACAVLNRQGLIQCAISVEPFEIEDDDEPEFVRREPG